MTDRAPVTRFLLLLLIAVSVAGCGSIPTPRIDFLNALQPDRPLPYRARIETTRRSPEFTVRVDARGAGLEAVRESVRFPATRYCLRAFGSSRADWQKGPDGDWAASRGPDDRLVFRGRCAPRG